MRVTRSGGRKVATRRAHRPDARVYRALRLRRAGGRRVMWVGWAIAGAAAVLCGWAAYFILTR